jgi:Contractile injection system tube protein
MAGLVGLASALISGPYGKLKAMSAAGIDEDGKEVVPRWDFQFYPESVSIQMTAEYAAKQAIGGSHPLKSWSSTSGRTITFQLLVAREMKRKQDLPALAFLVNPQDEGNRQFNHDVRQHVDRWQAMLLPSYDNANGTLKAPPVIRLTAPGMGWGLSKDDADTIHGVVTSLGVEYTRIFTEEGIPKQARLDISIDEVVQVPGRPISFIGRETLSLRPWWTTTDADAG